MRIDYEGKSKMFDDISYTWLIESDVNTYRLSLIFCGGIDESGEQNLYTSSLATIEITEIDHHDYSLIKEVYDLLSDKVLMDITSDTMCISIADVRTTISTQNTDSFDSTMADYNTMLMALTAVLLKHEMKQEAIA